MAFGLLGGLVWSVVTEASMPSWFDLDDSCPGASRAEKSYFPPSASCVHEAGRVVSRTAYVPLPKTVALTAFAVVLAVAIVSGLVVLGSRLRATGARGGTRVEPRRLARHILGAAMLGAATAVFGRAVTLFALFLGGPPGGVCAVGLVGLGAVAAAKTLDTAAGPGGNAAARRAVALVAIGIAATATLTALLWDEYTKDNTVAGPLWAPAAAAGVFAIIAAAQWWRSRSK